MANKPRKLISAKELKKRLDKTGNFHIQCDVLPQPKGMGILGTNYKTIHFYKYKAGGNNGKHS